MTKIRVTFTAFFLLGLLSILNSQTASAQGSLLPPGPPAPIMKTLDQIEPRKPLKTSDLPVTITQPGSYYLSESINFTKKNLTAIVLASNNVTIDLNGFTMTGPWTTGQATGSAIATAWNTHIENIRIQNGTITHWGGPGIDLNIANLDSGIDGPGTCWQYYLSQVTSTNNGGTGITATARGFIDHCIASYNAGDGIYVMHWTTISNCILHGNMESGIVVFMACRVLDNSCNWNGLNSADGDAAGIRIRAGVGGRHQILNNYLEYNKNGIVVRNLHGTMVTGNYAFDSVQNNFVFPSGSGFLAPIITKGNMGASNPPNANYSWTD